jgi:Subtilase family
VGSMTFNSRLYRPVSAILLLLSASTVSAAPASDWRTRVSPDLLAVYDSATTPTPSIKATVPTGSVQVRSTARFDAQGRVQIDVNFDCAVAAPISALVVAGLRIDTTVKAPPMCVVEGWAATAALPTLAAVATVKIIELPHYAKPPIPIKSGSHVTTQSGVISQSGGNPAIDGNGVTIMNADKYIAQTSVNGAGITVGVINLGADSLSVIQGRGELPQVNVVSVSANPPPANQDEGTVMLEEVYAVAPGAKLAFCGPQTYAQYVSCVQNLIAANVAVLTDDLLFEGLDVMSDPAQNTSAQAIENILVANPGVMLFSAAGNNAKNYWQGTYTPTTIGAGSFTCQGQTDNYFELFTGTHAYNLWTVGGVSASDLRLAWANAGGVSTANYDLYVLNSSLSVVACAPGSGSTAVSGSTTYDVIHSASLSSPNTYYILIGTPDTSLNGGYLKLIGFGDNADQWSSTTTGSTSSPQDFAAGAITIGAVDGGDSIGNNIEPFSATGPIQFASGAMMQAPILVAPDDIYVDIVGTSFSPAMFSGTSAASPNAAAVAALIRSAFPSMTSAQTLNAMEIGAAPLSPSSTFGYGRVDALGALGQIPAPTVSTISSATIVGGSSSSPLPFTVGGTGALKVTALPSVSWMTPVISPSNCGNGASNCTLTLTPSIGSSSPSTVQVTVTDGANRAQSMQFPVTITNPPPPAASITSGAAQSVQVNAAIAPIGFSVSGTGPITVHATFNGLAVTLTSGCGTTTMTCSATMGSAGTVTGPQSLVVVVQDRYGQSTSTSTTVMITNPPPPTITITSGGTQSVTVNGSIAPVAFTISGTGTLTVTPNTSDIASITISSGCGTTTMMCTASLGTAQSSPGTATLTLTVEDSYVQSATATATVTENAPPSKSGGGALDPWALLGLSGLMLVQLKRSQRTR